MKCQRRYGEGYRYWCERHTKPPEPGYECPSYLPAYEPITPQDLTAFADRIERALYEAAALIANRIEWLRMNTGPYLDKENASSTFQVADAMMKERES